MKNIALVTYNRVGKDIRYADGWHGKDGRRALLVQNTHGMPWAARKDADTPAGDDRVSDETAGRVAAQIGDMWNELAAHISELDQVVIYLGSRGCEHAVELASTLPVHKVTFVACDCGLDIKESVILAAGLTDARRILCECGGHKTMERLFRRFMDEGVLMAPRWIKLEE